MRHSISSDHPHTEQPSTRWSCVGLAGFTLFLLKGILWLLAPVLLALTR